MQGLRLRGGLPGWTLVPGGTRVPSSLPSPLPALGCSSGETEAQTENAARKLPPFIWPRAKLAVTPGPSTLRQEERAPARGRSVGDPALPVFLWSDGRARLRAWPEAAACQPGPAERADVSGEAAAAPSGGPEVTLQPSLPPATHHEEGCRSGSEAHSRHFPPGPTVQRGSHCHGQSGSLGQRETRKGRGRPWRTNPPLPLAAGGPRPLPNLPAPSRPTGPGNPGPGARHLTRRSASRGTPSAHLGFLLAESTASCLSDKRLTEPVGRAVSCRWLPVGKLETGGGHPPPSRHPA